MTARRFNQHDAGLTLVELLVVLAVLGLLGGLATMGLRSASQSWRRISRHNAQSEDLRAVDGLLQRLLSQTYPDRVGTPAHSVVRFSGSADRIEFLAPLAQRFRAEDIVVHTLRFATDGTLYLTWHLDRSSSEASINSAAARSEERIAETSGGSFSYYGQADPDDEARWWTNWTARQILPRLIRIRFNWHGDSEDVVVAPLVTAAFCSIGAPDALCFN